MAWSTLPSANLPSVAELDEAHTAGDLMKRGSANPLDSTAHCMSKDQVANYLYMASGFSGTNCPTKSEILANKVTKPNTPTEFSASANFGWCPARATDLSWSNGGWSESKVLQWYDGSAWSTIATPAAGDTTYQHAPGHAAGSPHAGNNQYRIGWSDADHGTSGDWMTSSVDVPCPE